MNGMARTSRLDNKKGGCLNKVIRTLIENKILFLIASLLTYVFYGTLVGVSLMPSACIVHAYAAHAGFGSVSRVLIFAIILGLSLHVFWITSLLVFGVVERLMTLGIKPGQYEKYSVTSVRWLVYSGLHVLLINMTLHYMIGTPFAEFYFRLIGVKMGKNVFINSIKIFDPYLLELGDNVVVGGFAQITCHIFEGNRLILGKVSIGSNTLICAETFIMPGVEIGSCCNIGVCSHVRKNKKIPDNSIIMAMPGVSPQKIAAMMKGGEKQDSPRK